MRRSKRYDDVIQFNRMKNNPTTVISKFLIRISAWSIGSLIWLCLLTDIVISSLLSFTFSSGAANIYKFDSIYEEFFIVVLMAPIIETILFQHLVLKISMNHISKNKWIAIFVSAFLFGISHNYSIPYICKAFITGILYAGLYFLSVLKKKNPIIVVSITHAAYNFIGVVINHMF